MSTVPFVMMSCVHLILTSLQDEAGSMLAIHFDPGGLYQYIILPFSMLLPEMFGDWGSEQLFTSII